MAMKRAFPGALWTEDIAPQPCRAKVRQIAVPGGGPPMRGDLRP